VVTGTAKPANDPKEAKPVRRKPVARPEQETGDSEPKAVRQAQTRAAAPAALSLGAQAQEAALVQLPAAAAEAEAWVGEVSRARPRLVAARALAQAAPALAAGRFDHLAAI